MMSIGCENYARQNQTSERQIGSLPQSSTSKCKFFPGHSFLLLCKYLTWFRWCNMITLLIQCIIISLHNCFVLTKETTVTFSQDISQARVMVGEAKMQLVCTV